MPKLASMSIAQLRRELAKKQQRVERLQAERSKIVRKLEAVDRELSSLSGEGVVAKPAAKPAAAGGGKPKAVAGRKRGRKATLTDAILKVLSGSGKPLSVSEIAEGLKALRFKTRSKNLPNLVREALTRVKGVKRVARGIYTTAG